MKPNILPKRNIQFGLMGLAGLVILTLVLIYTGVLPFGNNQWSDKNYSKRADVFSVSGGDQSPVFTGKLIIDPAKPKVGEKQYFSIWAKDTDGIKEVTLTIKESTGKSKEIPLKLKEGTNKNGKWEGSWKAKRLSQETQYTANFIATNAQKQTTELTTFFDILGSDLQGFFGIKQAYAYGACSFTEIGATSISAPCVIPAGSTFGSNGGDLILNSAVEMATSSTMGAQGGDISISSTITMRTGSTMIFNQGRKISLPSPNSYILKSDDITVIKKGNLSFPNLTVTRSGTGYGTVNFSPPNTSHVLPHSKTYNLGQSVTLTAAANATSTFAGWSGACTNLTGTCTVSMTAAKSVNAIFTLNSYILTVTKSSAAAGTVTSAPTGINCGTSCTTATSSYIYNTSVILNASSSTGYTFSSWTGCDSALGTTCTISMTAAKSVNAIFTINSYALTVTKPGTGVGTVTSNPAGINCGATCSYNFNYNTSIILTAAASTGSTFTGWSGGGCSGTGTCTVTITAATTTVTATFTINSYVLTVTKSGTGVGTVTSAPTGINCGTSCTTATSSYIYNTSVILTAAANATSTFAGWSGACTNLTDTCTVSMTAAKSVNAIFTTTCQCSGTSVCCDGCNIRPSSTVCRASAGSCDVAETCSGLAVCPADTYQTSSTVCRSSAGACDVAETCSGSSASCPSDLKSTAQCRASAGACDVAESCNGTSNTCPTDSFLSSSSVCRASAGACDVAETCSGSSASCPTNIYAASGTVCATDYQCSSTSCGGDAQYKEKKCTGSGASCPSSWPSSWSIYENCGSTQKCDTDNNSYAQCYEDTCCGSHCGNGTCDCGETTYGTDACNQDCGPCVPQTCNGGPRGDGSCGLYPDGCGGSMNCGDCTMIWTDTCQGCHYAECANYQKGVFYCDTSSGFGTGACRYYCNPDPTCLLNPDGTPKCSS
jgi:hypothetical protein